jgi:hypothetical protein
MRYPWRISWILNKIFNSQDFIFGVYTSTPGMPGAPRGAHTRLTVWKRMDFHPWQSWRYLCTFNHRLTEYFHFFQTSIFHKRCKLLCTALTKDSPFWMGVKLACQKCIPGKMISTFNMFKPAGFQYWLSDGLPYPFQRGIMGYKMGLSLLVRVWISRHPKMLWMESHPLPDWLYLHLSKMHKSIYL